ncbi:MAG: ATP-dependent Clp protease ATP-binding subunit [Clostridiales bacterium]|nr:ATP-dependent Clp protease ATP-binding subunit [Clostridiales bacterium]
MKPTLCSRCQKNVAVVFITRLENGETKNEGLCLKCAKELGIQPVNELIDKMGISDEDMDNLTGEMMNAFGGPEALEELTDGDEPEQEDEEEEHKTATFPFLNKLFNHNNQSGRPQDDSNSGSGRQDRKNEPPRDRSAQGQKNGKRKFLESYCQSLTGRAREGKLDNIIGRQEEIARVIQILNRRQKNNPCLIGEPGVGKTAIAEGLAIRIVEGNVPYKLRDKEVYLLDLTALVAGTQFRGQFESRMKGLIDEIKSVGNVILVIDEIHNIVGAGDAEGSMNAANILKPALSRGKIQVIGATTFNEYRKYIEKDAALERRFQPVTVAEPSIDDAVEVIRGVAHYYEDYHQVIIPDAVARDAVLLSERYITDRYLPDKAIDLIDEACSDVNLHNANLAKIAALEKDKADLEKEQEMLQLQSSQQSEAHNNELTANEKQISRRRQELSNLNAARQNLRANTSLTEEQREERLRQNADQTQHVKEEMAKLQEERRKMQEANDDRTFEQRAIIQSKILQTENQLSELKAIPRPELSVENLARVIEQWTDIPASRIQEVEFARLSTLGDRLKEHIVGRDEAVEAVTAAIRRNRVGISPKHKPVSFIFVGSTGVGKTELAKRLAEDLFSTPDSLIRLDMSEYMETYAVSKMIGSPPGYVGYDEAGQLTERVRRRPYSVILFDEIEKAHPDVLNIMLQILDDGQLTDSHGRKVNFENTVIVMTSNAGSNEQVGSVGFGKTVNEQDKDKTMKALQGFLRPEFINRVDEIIHFNRLSEENFRSIACIMLGELRDALAEKRITFTWDDSLLDYLTEKSYSLTYGARNLRRLIQKELEDAIASVLIDQYMIAITRMHASAGESGIVLQSQ